MEDDFTHWFTGILMPFQYAEDEEAVRRYVANRSPMPSHQSPKSCAISRVVPPP